MPTNTQTFKRRYLVLSKSRKNPRVPAKHKNEDPSRHSDLFVDENPAGTIHGLRFRNKTDAQASVARLKKLYRQKKVSFPHMRQIGVTMEQRSRFHAHPTPGIKEGNKVWRSFNRSFRK